MTTTSPLGQHPRVPSEDKLFPPELVMYNSRVATVLMKVLSRAQDMHRTLAMDAQDSIEAAFGQTLKEMDIKKDAAVEISRLLCKLDIKGLMRLKKEMAHSEILDCLRMRVLEEFAKQYHSATVFAKWSTSSRLANQPGFSLKLKKVKQYYRKLIIDSLSKRGLPSCSFLIQSRSKQSNHSSETNLTATQAQGPQIDFNQYSNLLTTTISTFPGNSTLTPVVPVHSLCPSVLFRRATLTAKAILSLKQFYQYRLGINRKAEANVRRLNEKRTRRVLGAIKRIGYLTKKGLLSTNE